MHCSLTCQKTLLALFKGFFCCALFLGCREGLPLNNTTDRTLLTTTPPVARMVEAVMGHPVDRLVPDSVDATQWSPSELQLDRMANSFLISNGRGFEANLRRYDLPSTSWLRSANMLAEPAIFHDVVEHQHGHEGSHSHGVIDGHTWVDPATAVKQLEAIRQRLVQEGFCSEQESQTNVRALVDQLQQVHQAFSKVDPQSIVFYANRAVYDYLARTHAWNITAFDFDPESPLPEGVASKLALMGTNRIFLLESAPGPDLIEDLGRLEIPHVVIPTGANTSGDERWPEGLATGAERLQNAISSLLPQKKAQSNP